uniref:Uncharacterized protein n=1 Tax=Sphaerodactylus townsendi TaxID=933632 RepID=A0ACB8F077_9SAUR
MSALALALLLGCAPLWLGGSAWGVSEVPGEGAPAGKPPQPLPTVVVAVLARNAQHSLPYYLGALERLDYPKERISICICVSIISGELLGRALTFGKGDIPVNAEFVYKEARPQAINTSSDDVVAIWKTNVSFQAMAQGEKRTADFSLQNSQSGLTEMYRVNAASVRFLLLPDSACLKSQKLILADNFIKVLIDADLY